MSKYNSRKYTLITSIYRAKFLSKDIQRSLQELEQSSSFPRVIFPSEVKSSALPNPHWQCLINVLFFPLQSLFQIASVKSSLGQSSEGNMCMQIFFFGEESEGGVVNGLGISFLRMITISILSSPRNNEGYDLKESFSLLG